MCSRVSLYAAATILKLSILYANAAAGRVACFLVKPAAVRLIENNNGPPTDKYLKTCVPLTVSG